MKNILKTAAVLLMLGAAPVASQAQTYTHHHPYHHYTHSRTVAAQTYQGVRTAGYNMSYDTWRMTHPNQSRAEYDSYINSRPTYVNSYAATSPSVPARAYRSTRRAGDYVSFETWRMTHPNQARAEYDAERAAALRASSIRER